MSLYNLLLLIWRRRVPIGSQVVVPLPMTSLYHGDFVPRRRRPPKYMLFFQRRVHANTTISTAPHPGLPVLGPRSLAANQATDLQLTGCLLHLDYNGLDCLSVVHVMEGVHRIKELKESSCKFPAFSLPPFSYFVLFQQFTWTVWCDDLYENKPYISRFCCMSPLDLVLSHLN